MAKNINHELFYSSKEDFDKKALDIMHKHEKIQAIIDEYKISDKEILDNLLTFLNIKESLDNPKVYPWIYSLKRNNNNKLVFSKTNAKNDYKLAVTRHVNLWLTEISNPNNEASLAKVRLSSLARRDLYSNINMLGDAIAKKHHQGMNGIYIYGKDRTGKTYIAHAIANSWSSNGVSTVYVTTNDLYNYLVKNLKDNNSINDEIVSRLKSVSALIIDELGLEKHNNWFRFDILKDIIDSRLSNNKITVFVSPLSDKELTNYYLTNTKQETFKMRNLLSKIFSNSNIYCIDEVGQK